MVLLATPQLIMRASAASIYFFDYMMTLPSEYRIYKRQKKIWNPSAACILFVLSRYVTLVSIVMATAFFFGTTWTEKTCVPAVGGALRALSASIVSLIFMWRAWAIWHKRQRILYFLMIALLPTTVFTWGFVFNQVPEVKNGSCGGLAGPGVFGAKWPFALANIVFDAVCVGLSTYKLALNLKNGSSQISSILLVDGLGYFFTSVALQVLNLIFLLSSDPAKQSTMITFTNAITGLLSQRIITSLSQRVVDTTSMNEVSQPRDRSLSRSRWMNGLRWPGQTPATKNGIELGNVMSVSVQVMRGQVADTRNSYEGTDSNKYAASMKESTAV
ncbi:hypothetical protein B0H16DRAFT_1759272 [Mycena metata]|uniref:DUF6533 domain-containing protein n=1 Tax=Mycena metata TaxID=1033252 RepID=A0AAD7HYK6_9AGAR|nr:hypothetical protein B0H16DRAFT_1773290 [Mycena metata]KAJ7738937.1 hypothetical protein B0H16DRAFT_1759272 [Mycena metata]